MSKNHVQQESADSESGESPSSQSNSNESRNVIDRNSLVDHIRKSLMQRFNDFSITEEAIVLMNTILEHVLEKILTEAESLTQNMRSKTIELSSIDAAIEEVFGGKQLMFLNQIREKTVEKPNEGEK
ncbi:unnamed protein product [Caenorhabditis angaria]|uniref:Core Histone H2A/H2B/H3 domain-containing protein n=1 Tax=Caenorhabditis angaria TaxID=860376 RepID=A0A9P1J0N1_9PELO|nr:unnamed protein product [Caenorhabditis angaria]